MSGSSAGSICVKYWDKCDDCCESPGFGRSSEGSVSRWTRLPRSTADRVTWWSFSELSPFLLSLFKVNDWAIFWVGFETAESKTGWSFVKQLVTLSKGVCIRDPGARIPLDSPKSS